MRKVLASFLAAAMVASIGATMSFAATTNTSANATSDITSTVAANKEYTSVRLTIMPKGFSDPTVDIVETRSINIAGDATGLTVEGVAKALNNTKFNDVTINGEVYNLTLKQVGTSKNLTLTFSPATTVTGLTNLSLITLELLEDDGTAQSVWSETLTNVGTGGELADTDRGGNFDSTSVLVSDVIKSYGDGTPIPLTESGVGVDKNLNDEGGVQSGDTLYFMVRDDVIQKLSDDTYWKLKYTKGDNGKYIKALSDVTKNFSNDLYDANTGERVSGTGGSRKRYLKVELNEIFTDDEYKIKLDMRISAGTKAHEVLGYDDDTLIKVKDFSFYMKNIVKNADNDWEVGVGGLMLNPLENDWNEVTYYDEDGDLAYVKFFADSDVGKFYAKLSTKWEHADYASYFNDQEAFTFQFTGSPKLSSTSRADLAIYNPFVDEDGNETIDPETATIYQIVDGDLVDVTDSFEYKEAESGDMAYCTRTRFLGSYIICERPVQEAVDNDSVPEDLLPEDTAPEVTPDAGGKAPANTGKYL